MIKITTHREDALARFLYQYQDSVRLKGIVEEFADQIQMCEDEIFKMLDILKIDVATGLWLDLVGRIVGVGRETFTFGGSEGVFVLDISDLDSEDVLDGRSSTVDDVLYRALIKAEIMKNFVKTKSIDYIYDVIMLVINPAVLEITEGVAEVDIYVDLDSDTAKLRILQALIAKDKGWFGKPAGVEVVWDIDL